LAELLDLYRAADLSCFQSSVTPYFPHGRSPLHARCLQILLFRSCPAKCGNEVMQPGYQARRAGCIPSVRSGVDACLFFILIGSEEGESRHTLDEFRPRSVYAMHLKDTSGAPPAWRLIWFVVVAAVNDLAARYLRAALDLRALRETAPSSPSKFTPTFRQARI